MRRAAVTLVASLWLLVLAPAAATADVTVSFRSPEPDALLDDPVDIVVAVDRDLVDAAPERVTVALSRDGVTPIESSDSVDLVCLEGCDGGTTSTSVWGGVTFDPSTLEPFGEAPICNGRWWLLAHVEPQGGGRAGQTHGRFTLSFSPSPVRDLRAGVTGGEVVLAWSPVPDDDLAGYLVERRLAGAVTWETIADLPPDARGVRDRPPSEDEFEYRVVTLGPDGYVDGEPAAACFDRAPDLATPSEVWRVSLAGDGETATATSEGSPSAGTSEDGTATAGATASPADDVSPDGSSGAASAGSSSGSSARSRIATPPRASGGSLDAPAVGSADGGQDEEYFGEDDAFSEELDYSGVEGVTADDPSMTEEEVAAGHELGNVELGGVELDHGRILRSVAAGLVLIALALHLRRWMRES